MLLPKQDRLSSREVHERGAERPGEPLPFRFNQIDVRLAVDLRPAQEEDVDAPLAGEVEQLARAFAERVAFALVQHRQAQGRVCLPDKQGACGGDGRSRPDRDMPRAADQAGDGAGEQLFAGVHTNSAR